jgi:hypothetical protein
MRIVVARYNENIEWTKQFPNTIIYNKGNKLEDGYDEILLENVGREGHTYYKHIYDNYENLDDYTIFLQGNPFDHEPNIISKLNEIVKKSSLDVEFDFLSNCLSECNLSGCNHQAGLPLIDVYEKLFNLKKTCMEFKFSPGAQFLVSKRQILKRPREFYLKIVEMLNKDKNPIEGFVIERFHKLIFCGHLRVPTSFKIVHKKIMPSENIAFKKRNWIIYNN